MILENCTFSQLEVVYATSTHTILRVLDSRVAYTHKYIHEHMHECIHVHELKQMSHFALLINNIYF